MNPLDSNQIALLRRTHAQILPGAAAFGVGFYCHLFTQDPALRCLFPEDIETRTRKLMDLIQALLDRSISPNRRLRAVANWASAIALAARKKSTATRLA